ncbi:SNF2-related protein, partial [Escherichia coli]|nr:SNF2-related protein [Escherichia coli]
VLCQFWAERRRRLLVICPASIRKQWAIELFEKFSLPTVILDAREYRSRQVNGYENPFQCNEIVITSLHYASQKAAEIRSVPWDLVVID